MKTTNEVTFSEITPQGKKVIGNYILLRILGEG